MLDGEPFIEKLRTMKERVAYLLEKYPVARDNDVSLILMYLVEYRIAFYSKNSGWFIPLKHYKDLPSFESITRARRLLQAEGLFVSSMPVREARVEQAVGMRMGVQSLLEDCYEVK